MANAGQQCEAAKVVRVLEVHQTRAQRAAEARTLSHVRRELALAAHLKGFLPLPPNIPD